MSLTRYQFSRMILEELAIGDGTGISHAGARRALVAWMGAESGWYARCDGIHGAKFNPLNTTMFMSSCTAAVKYNQTPGVQNYLTALCGAEAVVATLRETPDRGYEAIIVALSRPFVTAKAVLVAVGNSGWGTDPANLLAVLSTYQANRTVFNAVQIGPVT